MIIVGAYFKSDQQTELVERLLKLPDPYRANRFGPSENRSSGALGAAGAYERFLAKNPQGHFLFAQRCRFDITSRFVSGYGTVFVDPAADGFEDEGANTLFEWLAEATEFAFACQSSEYHSRNRICVTLGQNTVEAWVGRDLRKYVPGVYWRTAASADVVSRFSLVRLANDLSNGEVQVSSRGRLYVRMGNASANWREWREAVGRACGKHRGLFCVDDVLERVRGAVDHSGFSAILAEWR